MKYRKNKSNNGDSVYAITTQVLRIYSAYYICPWRLAEWLGNDDEPMCVYSSTFHIPNTSHTYTHKHTQSHNITSRDKENWNWWKDTNECSQKCVKLMFCVRYDSFFFVAYMNMKEEKKWDKYETFLGMETKKEKNKTGTRWVPNSMMCTTTRFSTWHN